MLHIFLVILKIIGILLAVVLGLIVLCILSMLFCPLRYHITGHKKDGWMIKANIRFLGPLIRFSIWYEKEVGYRLRIVGIPFLSSNKRPNKDKTEKRAKHKKSSKDKTSILEEEEEWDKPIDHSDKEEEKLYIEKVEGAHNEYKEEPNEQNVESNHLQEEGMLERFWNKITAKIQKVLMKLRLLFHNIGKYYRKLKEIYEDERVHTGFTTLKAELWLLLRKIRPKKIRWYLKIGFDEPSTTGQLLAVLAVLQGIWGPVIQVEPDFEHKIFETDFSVKGFIQGFRLLRLLLKGLFNKEIKYLLEKVRG